MRQVQADEVQGRHLREVRRRGDAVARAARAHGPYRARRPRRAHLVPEVAAVAYRAAARHDAEGSRAHPLFRILHRSRSRADPAQGPATPERGRLPPRPGRVRPGFLHRADRRRGDPRDLEEHGSAGHRRAAQGRDLGGHHRTQAEEARQAPEDHRGVHAFRQQAGVDDPHDGPGDPAGSAPARAARRRPLRDVGPERSLSPRHQPQQSPEAADRPARSGHHHSQREAHAAGGRRRSVRQRPPRPRHHGRQQAAAEVARRHAEGQAGPLPAEPARQARRLFRPLGDRRRPRS